MGRPLFSLKRHALRRVMTVLFFAVSPHSPSCALSAETGDLQELLNKAESESTLEQLLDLADRLKSSKILINQADVDDLCQLPWLKRADAEAIIIHRRDKGPILTLQELELIIGKEKTASIAPYIQFGKKSTFRRPPEAKTALVDGSFYSRLFWETPPRSGILDGTYAGENYKLYNRLQLSAPHLKASLVQEKDIGEADVADFSAISLNAFDLGHLKSVVLGNYKLNVAQGLLIGQGRYFSKGSDPVGSVRLPSKLLLPSASSTEYGFLQGAAATLKYDPFEVTLFYSSDHRDAVINDDGVVTSFSTSGYHRNELETGRKDNVTEIISGVNLLYRYQAGLFSGRAGGSVLDYHYPLSIDDYPSSATLYSLESDLSIGKASLFAEAAFSTRLANASWIAGAEYEILHGLSAVAAIRRYGNAYSSPFAGAFAERGSDGSNERGYYVGLNAKISNRLSVASYYDHFTFPALGINYPFPSDGNDSRLIIIWKQSPLFTWNFQFQHKYREEEFNQGTSYNPHYTAYPQVSDRCRLDCDVALSRTVQLRSRGEVKKVVKEYPAGDQQFYGWMAYQQLGYSAGKFSVKGRMTIFNTEDYDAALYAYEDDLPLTSSLGLYNGRGKSLFLVATWQLLPQMKLGARYEVTWYSDRELYGSGDDARATSAPGSFHLGCFFAF